MAKTPKKTISEEPMTLERLRALVCQLTARVQILEETLRDNGIYL
jgi:hypothetical protein